MYPDTVGNRRQISQIKDRDLWPQTTPPPLTLDHDQFPIRLGSPSTHPYPHDHECSYTCNQISSKGCPYHKTPSLASTALQMRQMIDAMEPPKYLLLLIIPGSGEPLTEYSRSYIQAY